MKVTGPGILSHVINIRHYPVLKTAAFLYVLPERQRLCFSGKSVAQTGCE